MTLRRVALGGLLALLVFLGGFAALVLTSTDYESRGLAYYGKGGDPATPSWTKPCRRLSRRYQRRYVLPCARVDGIVVFRQSADPDGDGDHHVVAAAGRGFVIVKSGGSLPGLGRRVRAAGLVSEGRLGMPTIDTRPRGSD